MLRQILQKNKNLNSDFLKNGLMKLKFKQINYSKVLDLL